MPKQPLKAFSPPEGLSFVLPIAPTPLMILTWIFDLVVVYWLIYTLIAVYHWLTYSHNANIAAPAIVLHIFVSLVLMGYAISGLI